MLQLNAELRIGDCEVITLALSKYLSGPERFSNKISDREIENVISHLNRMERMSCREDEMISLSRQEAKIIHHVLESHIESLVKLKNDIPIEDSEDYPAI